MQFVNVIDFMMVMPLGPRFARALTIPESSLGAIGGAYTGAAAISGLAGAFILDRFDRRRALMVAMLGLAFGTAIGGFATGFASLIAARLVAGFFGGPATSIALSIVTDAVPAERRGQALSKVMGAFSIASILGVPAGLKLAELGGWQLPFFGIGALCLVTTAVGQWLLPTMPPRASRLNRAALGALFEHKRTIVAYALTAVMMASGFLVVPNIAAYVQGNLEFPEHDLPWAYLAGGVASAFTMAIGGKLIDRFGSLRVTLVGCCALAGIVYAGFIHTPPYVSVIGIFVLFMVSMSLRNLSANTLVTKVPRPEERAGFMSLQSCVQHMACALGAFISSKILTEGPNHTLVGMARVGWACIGLQLLVIVITAVVERDVLRPVDAIFGQRLGDADERGKP